MVGQRAKHSELVVRPVYSYKHTSEFVCGIADVWADLCKSFDAHKVIDTRRAKCIVQVGINRSISCCVSSSIILYPRSVYAVDRSSWWVTSGCCN